jgi:hypothetical protein
MDTTTPHGTALAALVVVLALAGASTVAAAPGAASAVQDQAAISVSSETVPANGTTTVTLTADAPDVAGYQANLTFDPSVVQVEQVAESEDFDSPVSNVNNDEGWVFLTQSKVEGTDDPVLARITFAAVGGNDTSSTIGFVGEETMLNDADSQTIDAELRPGQIRVTSDDLFAQNTSTDGQDGAQTNGGTDGDSGDDNGGILGGIGMLGLAAGGLVAVGGSVALGVYFGQRL